MIGEQGPSIIDASIRILDSRIRNRDEWRVVSQLL